MQKKKKNNNKNSCRLPNKKTGDKYQIQRNIFFKLAAEMGTQGFRRLQLFPLYFKVKCQKFWFLTH